MSKIYEMLATSFGLGYAPIAPGTFGTLGGVALAALFGWTWPELYLPLCLGTAAFLTGEVPTCLRSGPESKSQR